MGFLQFQFVVEEGVEVLYVYELQVTGAPPAPATGLVFSFPSSATSPARLPRVPQHQRGRQPPPRRYPAPLSRATPFLSRSPHAAPLAQPSPAIPRRRGCPGQGHREVHDGLLRAPREEGARAEGGMRGWSTALRGREGPGAQPRLGSVRRRRDA